MNYKNIGDNLTVNEFNGIISLLRDNVNFNEDIQITTSTVTGIYGDYTFDFREATVLDNGILITNETLSTVGTVQLDNPVFPHSNYYLDLKVYSSNEPGISGLDSDDVIVTPLTIKLENGAEVNIPFETLEMNNIIGFDASVRIDHKDLVIRGTDKIHLNVLADPLLHYVGGGLEAVYIDEDDYAVEGKSINFYEGETLIGTHITDSEGKAVLSESFSAIGSHTVQATSESIFSNTSTFDVVDEGNMIIEYQGNQFRTNNAGNTPFNYTGKLQVEYEDNTGEFYSNGNLEHNYQSTDNHVINLLGNITAINSYSFNNCAGLRDITLPNSLTNLEDYCFKGCTGLNSVIIPENVTFLGAGCFNNCTSLESIVLPTNLRIIGFVCFGGCSSLTSISIPQSVSLIGGYCFGGCTDLTEIVLNWDDSSDIVLYDDWLYNCTSFDHFLIPQGTTALYVAKGYPSSMLVEDISFDGIDLESDKSILSAADHEYATLTAQLTFEDEPVAIEGETVTFEVRKQSDDSLVETLTADTDSSGIATVSYLGNGVGDIYIKAECNLLIRTFVVQDCYKYDATEHSQSFSSSTVSQEVISGFSWDNTDDWSCSFDLKVSTGGKRIDIVPPTESLNHHLGIGKGGEGVIKMYVGKSTSGEDGYLSSIPFNNNTYYSMEVIKQGSTVIFKCNGSTLQTVNNLTWLSNYSLEGMKYTSWSNSGTIYIKNIKIKPL